MRVTLLCVARRPSGWEGAAAAEYLKRLTGKLSIECRDLAPGGASLASAERREREARAILGALPAGGTAVALDERGEAWSTQQLADKLAQWRMDDRHVTFVIGGADGLADTVRAAAAGSWSLSRLTLPHQLARVIVLEQLYRASAILAQHPYHRA